MHVLIVLGRKLQPDGTASPDLVNRIEEARRVISELHGSGETVRTVLSGGRLVFAQDANTAAPSEASVMRELLLAGVGNIDAQHVVLDELSTHTLENAVFARKRIEGLLGGDVDLASVVVHLITSEVHMKRARACFSAVFEAGCDRFGRVEYHASPDGARVIPSETEGAIEHAMIRRLPHDLQLYREHETLEARRRFFTPNPEGEDGEPHPHTWLHDPYSGETVPPGSGIPPWINAQGSDQC
jgi:hypothetical protein